MVGVGVGMGSDTHGYTHAGPYKSLPDQYVSRSIVDIVSEAKRFFPTVEVSQNKEYYVNTYQIEGRHEGPSLAIQHAAYAN